MSDSKPAWMDDEENRSSESEKSGSTPNAAAPQLARVTRAPKRMQKAFYIQQKYARAFEDLVHKQKRIKGRKAPDLAEEAIRMLLEKYKEDTSGL